MKEEKQLLSMIYNLLDKYSVEKRLEIRRSTGGKEDSLKRDLLLIEQCLARMEDMR